MISGGSLFQQILGEIPRSEFDGIVRRQGAERYAKGFSCWHQLVSMLFCHMAAADSLREICNGLACGLGRLRHLGLDQSPSRSTLSYANAHRPASVYEELFWTCLDRFRKGGKLGCDTKTRRFRFKSPLLSLDSTTITLCAEVFPWARFRREKGGVKLHVLLNHSDYMPQFVVITEAYRNDCPIARQMPIKAGSIVVVDRAYVDFDLLARWQREHVRFVVRCKRNVNWIEGEQRAVHAPVTKDVSVSRLSELTMPRSEWYPGNLRLVSVQTEDGTLLELLTNVHDLAARTIGEIYRDRWKVELFFKALKQNLKVRTFVGTTENALRIQVWTALLSLLILKWLHFVSMGRLALSSVAALLRQNLFTYRDLRSFFSNPLGTPPTEPPPQLLLPLFGPAHG